MTTSPLVTGKQPPALVRMAEIVYAIIDRRPRSSFGVTVGFFALCFVAFAIRIPFWADEVLTCEMLRLPDFKEILRALADGCDQSAPFFYAVLLPFAKVSTTSEFMLRLPSIAGFCVMCWGVYAFALRHLPAPYALVALLFVANSVRPFVANARPYAMELGCIAMALYCWQSAAAGVRRSLTIPLLGALLCAAVALHLFAIFVVVPLLAGESARWRRTRRIDWAILVALLVPALIVIPHRFMIETARRFAPFFLAKANFHTLIAFLTDYYGRYLAPLLLVIPAMLVSGKYITEQPANTARNEMPDYEWVAVIAISLSPFIVFLAGRLSLGVFADRYVLWSVIGVGLSVAGLLYRIAWQNHLAVVSAALVLFGLLGGVMISKVAKPHHISAPTRAANDVLPQLPAGTAPVLVSEFGAALVMWHYGPPELRARLEYPVDAMVERKYERTDTNALLAKAWGARISLRRPDLRDFLQSAPHFLMIGAPQDGLARFLKEAGYDSTRIAGPAKDVGIYEWRASGRPAE